MNEALSPKATRPETKLQLWRTKKKLGRKLWPKRNGLSLLLKVCRDSAEVTCRERLLQIQDQHCSLY